MLTWLGAHWAEILGFTTGAACVYLAARRNIWTFPLGIANNVVFLALFVSAGIYANAGLQAIYLVLGVHGWCNWRRARAAEPVFVDRIGRSAIAVLTLVAVVGTVVLWWILRQHTDSDVPYADAATTSVSLVAQYMLNRRWLECWYVWIAVDVVYIGMYSAVGLPITAALYLVFIGLCLHGLFGWRAERRDVGARARHASMAS